MPTINQLSSIGEVTSADQIPTYDESNGDTRKMSVLQLQDYMQDNLNLPNNSDEVNFLQAGTSAVERTVQSKLRDVVSVKDFGAVCDGIADDTAEIIAADAAARSAGKPLLISGTPLISSTITLSAKTHWVFDGSSGAAMGDLPASYIKKSAALNGTAIVVAADGTKFEGGGIVGVAGNGGDGLRVTGNSFSWTGSPYIYLMGRDGIRIGADVVGSYPNSFYIEHAKSSGNGRHGINLNDAPGTYPNANAGMLVAPFCHHNTSHGLYINNANLGNVIICPLLEANTGSGLYFDTEANRNVVIGGDIEANGTNFTNNAAIKFGNRLENVTINGVVTSTSSSTDLFTPTIYGGSTAGSGTYTTQKGVYTLTNGVLSFAAQIAWSAHTGTGQIYIDLPNLALNSIQGSISANVPAFIPVSVISTGISLSAGAQMFGLVNTASSPPRIQLYTSNAGVVSSASMVTSGTYELYISGAVTVINL
jgi:hypothetical protein